MARLDAKTTRFCLKLNLMVEDERKASGKAYGDLVESCLGALPQPRHDVCHRIEEIPPDEYRHYQTLTAIKASVCGR